MDWKDKVSKAAERSREAAHGVAASESSQAAARKAKAIAQSETTQRAVSAAVAAAVEALDHLADGDTPGQVFGKTAKGTLHRGQEHRGEQGGAVGETPGLEPEILAEKLRTLRGLLDEGLLTEQEFTNQKAKLLS